MKKLLIIMLLTLASTGCSQSVDSWQLLQAEELCKDSRVDKLNFHPLAGDLAFCADGTFHKIKHKKKTNEVKK